MKRLSDTRIFILVCLNVALYVLIIVLDIMKASHGVTQTSGLFCDICKYIAIISCLLICVFAYSRMRTKTPLIQTLVFCITLGADFFLLFTPFFTTGVFIFLGAHLCALQRYKPRWSLPAGISAASVFVLAVYFAPRVLHANAGLTLFIAVTAAYAVLIISVTVSTFHAEQPRTNALFSRVGMLLFLACDVNVMIFNTLPDDSALYTASIVLMWFFYLPAQTLLALSSTELTR